jgi:hypothetical protein
MGDWIETQKRTNSALTNATPTTASVNMTVGALNGPIGSHGAISWARLCPTHGDGGISHWRQGVGQ